jgi:hypothetical protein
MRTATAEQPRVAFQLPHCPTAMQLPLPEAFEGAVNHARASDNHADDSLDVVVALTSPKHADVYLQIGEPKGFATIQGSVSPDRFAHLIKTVMGDTPSGVPDFRVLHRSETADSVTVVGVHSVVVASHAIELYVGFRFSLVAQCIVNTGMSAPTSSMSEADFEDLARSVSIE